MTEIHVGCCFRLHGRTGYRCRRTRADLELLARFCRGRWPACVPFKNVSMWEDAQHFARWLRGT